MKPRPLPSPKKRRALKDKCNQHNHATGCRPGRPLCRWMRKKQRDKYGVCECGAVPWPHRRGYCVGGAAYRYMVADVFDLRGVHLDRALEDEAFNFFEGLAAPVAAE